MGESKTWRMILEDNVVSFVLIQVDFNVVSCLLVNCLVGIYMTAKKVRVLERNYRRSYSEF